MNLIINAKDAWIHLEKKMIIVRYLFVHLTMTTDAQVANVVITLRLKTLAPRYSQVVFATKEEFALTVKIIFD